MINNKFDVIVIGGGHAGLEAVNTAVKMGMNTALITISISTLCKPSCNPNIGGTAKGHLVKEIDAFGGAMGVIADKAGLQFKMLNKSKGAAIWSPRVQIDKDLYPIITYQYLQNLNNIVADSNVTGKLTVVEDIVNEIIITRNNKVEGCKTIKNEIFLAKTIILCAGTFLNGKMFIGTEVTYGGRWGEPNVEKISELLAANGLQKGRLKTGTPPRVHKDSIDYAKVEVAAGDEHPLPLSYQTKEVHNKIVCYATESNLRTHDILRTGFEQSPMFSGMIEGIGPRYCPSIEDKINRFSHRDSHKILLEPEGLNTDSVYVNGFSTSLPLDVQIKGLHSISGLENCQLIRAGYAIEYDYFFPHQLKFTLETKAIENLFFAGQINGTSGYEEAGVQGLIAGINAVLKIRNEPPFSLKRSEAYTGVLIDDLVNKSTDEPYRMFTSLAEYRLLLRQDNAAERLIKYAYNFGLIPEWYYDSILEKKEILEKAFEETKNIKLKADIVNDYLESIDENTINDSTPIHMLSKRGKVDVYKLLNLSNDLTDSLLTVSKDPELAWKLGVEIKYEGYIAKQKREVEHFLENENKRIPENFNYDALNSISAEARQKLKDIRPASLGQASRISGVSATDVAVISFYLKI